MWKHAALVLALVGCAGDPEPTTTDNFGATCTMISETSTECDSMICTDAFNQLGLVCSEKCTIGGDGSECPAGADGTKKCNQKGYCRP